MTPRLLLALIVACVLGLSHLWTYRLGGSAVQAKWDRERAAAAEAAAKKQETRAEGAGKAVDVYHVQKRKATDNERVARADLERLRNAIAATTKRAEDAEAACRVDAERIDTLGRLLAESAGLVEEGRQRVDELTASLAGLQEWTRRVCLAK